MRPASKAEVFETAEPGGAQGRDRRARIGELMPPDQFGPRQVEKAVLVLIDEASPSSCTEKSCWPTRIGEAPIALGLVVAAGLIGLRVILRRDDGRAAAFEDARLFLRDAFNVVPRYSAWSWPMGVTDGGGGLVDDVGGVEAAAEADFEQQHVGGLSEKRRRAAAVVISNTVIGSPAFTASQRRKASTSLSSLDIAPPPKRPSRMRSWKRTR